MKPICVPCGRFCRVRKSGYYFTEGMPAAERDGARGKAAQGWKPYKVWIGDLYECPDCGHQLVSGVGFNRLAEHYEPDFENIVERTGAAQLLVKD